MRIPDRDPEGEITVEVYWREDITFQTDVEWQHNIHEQKVDLPSLFMELAVWHSDLDGSPPGTDGDDDDDGGNDFRVDDTLY